MVTARAVCISESARRVPGVNTYGHLGTGSGSHGHGYRVKYDITTCGYLVLLLNLWGEWTYSVQICWGEMRKLLNIFLKFASD